MTGVGVASSRWADSADSIHPKFLISLRGAGGEAGAEEDIVAFVFRVADVGVAVQAGDEVGTGLGDAEFHNQPRVSPAYRLILGNLENFRGMTGSA